ncbi:MAG: AtpZ/AtpI family protein [Elusimicrobiales bacterium]
MSEKSPWRHAQIGIQATVCVLAGFFGGRWLDAKFSSAPWLMLGGAAAGIAAGLYSAIRDALDDK